MYLSLVTSQGGGIHAGKESHPCIRVCRVFSTWDNENLNPITIYRVIDFHLALSGKRKSVHKRCSLSPPCTPSASRWAL